MKVFHAGAVTGGKGFARHSDHQVGRQRTNPPRRRGKELPQHRNRLPTETSLNVALPNGLR